MTLTTWVFTVSGTLLGLFTLLELFAAQKTERPFYLQIVARSSSFFERIWVTVIRAIEEGGMYVLESLGRGTRWFLAHGIRALFSFIGKMVHSFLRTARSRGVIKKRGAASLFLKQISEHKRQNSGGSIED